MSKYSTTRKCTFTLPRDTFDDICYVAKRMGISRSALVTQLTVASVEPMRELLEQTPEKPTWSEVRRLRGASVEVIEDAYTDAMEKLGWEVVRD